MTWVNPLRHAPTRFDFGVHHHGA